MSKNSFQQSFRCRKEKNLAFFFSGTCRRIIRDWNWSTGRFGCKCIEVTSYIGIHYRQHCRLTICIELVELTNSIRWQDPNNNTDTETRCLVYPRQNNFWRTSRQERRQRRRQPLFCPSQWHHPICDRVWIIPDIFQIQWKLWWPCHYLCVSLDVNPFPWWTMQMELILSLENLNHYDSNGWSIIRDSNYGILDN